MLIEHFTTPRSFKWCLHRRENITHSRCRQRWRFEKMGEFLLKSHRSAKLLDPNRLCERTFTPVKYFVVSVPGNVLFSPFLSLSAHLKNVALLFTRSVFGAKKYKLCLPWGIRCKTFYDCKVKFTVATYKWVR